MSSYTMQLKTYIEMWSQNETLSTRETVEKGRPKLFDFDYPIFNEDYRKVFETNFIRYYYHREIGFETEGLFKDRLETWLLINMPYYNSLFESQLIKFDPLINVSEKITATKKNEKDQSDNRDMTQTANTSGTGTGNSTQNGEHSENSLQTSNGTNTDDNFNRTIESNTPDQRLNLTANDGQGVIEFASKIDEHNTNNKNTITNKVDGDKSGTTKETATNSTTAKTDSTGKANEKLISEINELEDFIQSRVGKTGNQSYSSMILEYRSTLINLQKRVYEDMNELFMLVY